MNRPEGKGYSIVCKGVEYYPEGQKDLKILDGIDVTIKRGEFVSIIGENGSGKSSFLKAITGELKITKGTIKVGQQNISDSISKKVNGVGIVHQDFDEDLLLSFSVAMNVAFRQTLNKSHPNLFWACDTNFKKDLASTMGEFIGTDVETIVGYMSGGEKQMLNLVMAIHLEHIENPCKLLLLDEHTSKLDAKRASEIMDYTYDQVIECGATTLMVTHNLQDAISYSDRILIMSKGKIFNDLKYSKSLTIDKLKKELYRSIEVNSTG